MWKSSMRVCILLCILGSKLAGRRAVVSAVDPETLSDKHGNSADAQSNIVFANFSGSAEYHVHKKAPLQDDGLLPFYGFARAIASTTFGSTYPYDMVSLIFKKDFQTALGNIPVRFQFCLALGVILLLFFVFGVFVPFCLCFSDCCQRGNENAPSVLCVLIWGVIIIGLICFFASVGIGAAFQTDKCVSRTLPAVLDTLRYTPADLVTFVNFSAEQIIFIFVKINFTVKVINRDLDNVGSIVGLSILNDTELKQALKDLREIADFHEGSVDAVKGMEKSVDSLAVEMASLERVLRNAAPSGSSSAPRLNVTKPDLSPARRDIEDRQPKNVKALVTQSIKHTEDVPEKIQSEADSYITDLKMDINVQLHKLDIFQNIVEDMRDAVVTAVPLDTVEDTVKSVKSKWKTFDGVRSGLTGGLLWLDVVAMLLILAGVVMVTFFFTIRWRLVGRGEEPLTPFTNTVCGGRIIYAGIGIFMMLGWLWMLLSMLTFILGCTLDVVICSAVQDPEFKIVDELIEKRNILGEHPDGPWLASTLLNNPKVDITVGSVFRDCRADKTLFNATKLNHHPSINLSRIFDLNNLDLSAITSTATPQGSLISANLSSFLTDLPKAFDSIPFSQLQTFDRDVNDAKGRARAYYNQLGASAKSNIQNDVNGKLKNIGTRQEEIKRYSQRLKANLQHLRTRITRARRVQANLPNILKTATSKATEDFVKRVKNIVKGSFDEIKKNIYEDYGKCKILYDIFMSVVGRGLCDNVANVLNGIWLAMYWFHVFMLVIMEMAIYLNRLIPRPAPKGPGAKPSTSRAKAPPPPPPPTPQPKPPGRKSRDRDEDSVVEDEDSDERSSVSVAAKSSTMSTRGQHK